MPKTLSEPQMQERANLRGVSVSVKVARKAEGAFGWHAISSASPTTSGIRSPPQKYLTQRNQRKRK